MSWNNSLEWNRIKYGNIFEKERKLNTLFFNLKRKTCKLKMGKAKLKSHKYMKNMWRSSKLLNVMPWKFAYKNNNQNINQYSEHKAYWKY